MVIFQAPRGSQTLLVIHPIENFAGKNFSEFKHKLSEVLVDKIEPISTEIKKLLDDKSYLDNTLLEGVERANVIASKKIKRIKEIVGF